MSFQIQAYQMTSISYSRAMVSSRNTGEAAKSAALHYRQTEIIAFSATAQSMGQLDDLYQELSGITHPERRLQSLSEMGQGYQQLQEMLSGLNPSEAQSEQAVSLFEQIQGLLQQAMQRSSEVVSRVASQQDAGLSGCRGGCVAAQQRQEQSEGLQSLNQLLQQLFAELQPDEKQQTQLDDLFDMLNAQLNQAFAPLTAQQQAHIAVIEAEMASRPGTQASVSTQAA
ncbi:hypothetical protein Mmc1_1637 [Magnetococcus marinus MC-1]|uniref:DUF5610 domain-containing protein n=1 Tax=Magnetococcus marinus (strain ATCC BAA-1437 / JCM 17883 / MC-1) TaxID=156889 RepID=A0L853_MAGMM|nr:hypothetical protein [Magnetococcus marinus]ABK44146.1 hypothetical protein Mmc1_1637 [Magnetococcus marinus MC-1]